MKQRIIAAAFLTAFAAAAFAQETASANAEYIIVENGDAPPVGYAPVVPSYKWENGRFVQDGELYQSLHDGE
jgi:hypothetical protein